MSGGPPEPDRTGADGEPVPYGAAVQWEEPVDGEPMLRRGHHRAPITAKPGMALVIDELDQGCRVPYAFLLVLA